jgi:hypothetical protein
MEHEEGDFVLYTDYKMLAADYARLKDEVENSKRINTELLALSNRQASDIRRLTKAALQVHQELDEFGQVSAKSVHELRDAAKGVQS